MRITPLTLWVLAAVGVGCGVTVNPSGKQPAVTQSAATQIVAAPTTATATEDDHLAWTTVDSWYKQPTSSPAGETQQVPFREVKLAVSAEAVRRLSAREAVQISAAEADQYTDKTVRGEASSKLFLVRAVYLNHATGGFFVEFDGTDLFVEHGSLGHHAVPMTRTALVVAVPKAPARVYVTASMAE